MNESEEKREKQNEADTPANTSPDTQENAAYTSDTDRVNGEYHYKNGYTQKNYSDAHYVHADEDTVPPRYYTPPQKPVKEPKAPKEKKLRRKKNGMFMLQAICMCLVCALLGGITGAAIMEDRLSDRIDTLEASVEKVKSNEQQLTSSQPSEPGVPGSISASKIYAQACEQVVGITSEVTYINFFGMASPQAVSGSGFIISSDGYILTNYHVVELAYKGKQDVSVMLHDGTKYPAVIVGVEECNDVAVLKIDANNLTPAQFGNSDELLVGDAVYAVGNPLGELEFSMSSGHVSALDRLIVTEDNSEPINMFQIDAAVNHGNSGGPVYNSKGQVVGIVTAKSGGTDVEGLGFAIPINDVVSIADDLITKGYVTGKAYMGIRFDDRYNPMYAQYYNMPIGVFIIAVDVGGAAEEAGLQSGDIITKLGDDEITSYKDLKKAIRQYSAGDSATIEFFRAGENKSVTITFDDLKPEGASASPASVGPKFGSNYRAL